jgi:hypothetical protein
MARYKKSDVEQIRPNYYGERVPAVNVKVYGSMRDIKLPLSLGQSSDDGGKTWIDSLTDAEYTHDWIEENVSDSAQNSVWESVIAEGWEQIQNAADEIYGEGYKVYSAGRSGGWAYIENLPDFDSWDAIDLAKWRKFELAAKAIAADVPYQMVVSLYMNEYEYIRDNAELCIS